MGLIVKRKPKTTYPPVEAGTYAAVCVGIIDIGEQYSPTFKKYADKLMIVFEIPSETIEIDGEQKPRWISQEFMQSLNEKANLYKLLTSWLGRALTEEELEGFDLFSLLGKSCFINLLVEQKESGSYNRISAVMGLPKGMPEPKTESELIGFAMADGFNEDVFGLIPVWIQDKIKKSTQYQKKYAKVEKLDFPDEAESEPEPEKKETAAEKKEIKDEEVPF